MYRVAAQLKKSESYIFEESSLRWTPREIAGRPCSCPSGERSCPFSSPGWTRPPAAWPAAPPTDRKSSCYNVVSLFRCLNSRPICILTASECHKLPNFVPGQKCWRISQFNCFIETFLLNSDLPERIAENILDATARQLRCFQLEPFHMI